MIKNKIYKEKTEAKLTKQDLPFTVGMIILDIATPIFLMFGLTMTTSANASLLNNFEIVTTSVNALLIFKEYISKRLGIALKLLNTHLAPRVVPMIMLALNHSMHH